MKRVIFHEAAEVLPFAGKGKNKAEGNGPEVCPVMDVFQQKGGVKDGGLAFGCFEAQFIVDGIEGIVHVIAGFHQDFAGHHQAFSEGGCLRQPVA